MAITNYGTLKTAVASWSARGDLADQIPDFIQLAHEIIVREMVLSTDITLDDDTVALPTDCREIVSLWPVTRATAPMRMGSELEMANCGTGVPQLYRMDGSYLTLSPAPNQDYAGRLLYRPVRTFFTSDTATNTVLTRYPFLYLHGALTEFMRFDRDAQGEVSYGQRFQTGLDRAKAAEIAQVTGGAALQTQSGIAV